MESLSKLTDIIKDHESSLLRYAARLLNDNEGARDIVQDAFVRFVKASQKIKESSAKILNPTAWLYRATRNLCYDQFRSKRRQMEVFLDEDADIADFADRSEGPDTQAAKQDQIREIRKAMNVLSVRDREILILKMEQDKSYKEIAEIMDITVSNVGFIIHNSVKKLKESINTADL